MSKRVLIVEDSRTEALRARLLLEREGFQVSLAADGKEGLQKAALETPDAILLDAMMPGMSGFETCGRLKIDPKTRRIPVMIMAAAEEQADMPSGPGSDCFLTKPYDPTLLVSQVKQLIKQAEDGADEARSDFLANMSHELRTPLHEIIGMTELLFGTELTSEQQGYLNTTRTSSNALLSLIGDVIEFSELEAGQLDLQIKEFDLSEPIERTAEIMAPRAAEKGLRFSATLPPGAPRALMGDPNRLRQILANLVANAVKFTERGEVAVRVDAKSVEDNEVELHISVSDTGIGIPVDRREIIFEPFQQSDTSITRRFGGLGMGLAIAKQLVKLMGGRIWAESQQGEGSIFHFVVKLEIPAKTSQLAPISSAANNWPRPLNILVAEDSPTNQLIARSSLTKAGHTVTLAENGLKAVQAFGDTFRAGQSSYDLALMDVSMPEMDGLEATRAIREREKTLGGHLVIVAMTAFATKEYHEKCLESGMDAYVTKPVRVEELNKTLEPLMANESEPRVCKSELPAPVPHSRMPVDLREALEVVGGDVDIMRDAVAMSIEEVPEQIAGLKSALSRQDAKGVEAKAHRLKGVMGNIGGLIARDVAQRLETMGERGNLAGGAELVSVLEAEIGRVTAFYADPVWEQRARECEAVSDD